MLGVTVLAALSFTPAGQTWIRCPNTMTQKRALPAPAIALVKKAPLRIVQANRRPWLAKVLLGDTSKSPIKASLRKQLKFPGAKLIPDDLIDAVIDQLLRTADAIIPGGFQKLLTKPGLLQGQREQLRREWAKKLAQSINTGLGDEIERQLGEALIDAFISLLLEEADFLKPPAQRLNALEAKAADVKAEMGLLRLLALRVRQRRLVSLFILTCAVVCGLWASPTSLRSATVSGAIALLDAAKRWLVAAKTMVSALGGTLLGRAVEFVTFAKRQYFV